MDILKNLEKTNVRKISMKSKSQYNKPDIKLVIPSFAKIYRACLFGHSEDTYRRCTVTRPYAGFRHPDWMAPESSVRGGENDCFIWSGNLLT
jgi:hypothetical protein